MTVLFQNSDAGEKCLYVKALCQAVDDYLIAVPLDTCPRLNQPVQVVIDIIPPATGSYCVAVAHIDQPPSRIIYETFRAGPGNVTFRHSSFAVVLPGEAAVLHESAVERHFFSCEKSAASYRLDDTGQRIPEVVDAVGVVSDTVIESAFKH